MDLSFVVNGNFRFLRPQNSVPNLSKQLGFSLIRFGEFRLLRLYGNGLFYILWVSLNLRSVRRLKIIYRAHYINLV